MLATADGVWLYEPKEHSLLLQFRADIRTHTGLQDFVGTARSISSTSPTASGCRDISPQERRLYASVDTGFIGQNVYLFCASEGLATVFRGAVNYEQLDRINATRCSPIVTFAQTFGYPRS